MKDKQLNIRIDTNTLNRIEEIAKAESKKMDYTIRKSDIINKALNQFLNKYK
jgi:predicted DNA-binding protein